MSVVDFGCVLAVHKENRVLVMERVPDVCSYGHDSSSFMYGFNSCDGLETLSNDSDSLLSLIKAVSGTSQCSKLSSLLYH